jgi:alkyl hydroperoxide reductase subunit AhpC
MMFFLYLSDIFLNFTNKNNSASKERGKKVSGFSKDQYSSRNLKEEIKAEKKSQCKKIQVIADLNNEIKKF